MWLFRHKYHANGSLSRYKARLVANDNTQQLGVDCNDTFSPVVKPATTRSVLSVALSRNWPIHQLDVKNAFLNRDFSETVYMYQPPGFVDVLFPHQVCRLQRAHMANCNPTQTSVDTESKLDTEGDPVSDPSLYCSLAVGLQYLTFTRPDISYAIQHVCLHMYDPREPHFAALKRVFCYIRGTTLGSNFILLLLVLWLLTLIQIGLAALLLGNILSRSSAEAEYKGVSNAVAETVWLRNLLCELHTPLFTLFYCDNVRVLHVPSRYQYADIFTNGLPSALFEEFRTSLSVRPSPAQTARECRRVLF
nr:hypothetical protein [Tanacetum cinerariifolium]